MKTRLALCIFCLALLCLKASETWYFLPNFQCDVRGGEQNAPAQPADVGINCNQLKRDEVFAYTVYNTTNGQEETVIPEHFVKWEGFTSAVADEKSWKIWMYPQEAKEGSTFASSANVAREGNYIIFLRCRDRGDEDQSQAIQFEVEVDYGLAQ